MSRKGYSKIYFPHVIEYSLTYPSTMAKYFLTKSYVAKYSLTQSYMAKYLLTRKNLMISIPKIMN